MLGSTSSFLFFFAGIFSFFAGFPQRLLDRLKLSPLFLTLGLTRLTLRIFMHGCGLLPVKLVQLVNVWSDNKIEAK